MDFSFNGNSIVFHRELFKVDKLVFKFVSALEKAGVDYVIVSGYVATIFGRKNEEGDVDFILEEMPLEKFVKLWRELHWLGFYCLNAIGEQRAFEDFLDKKRSIRFAEDGSFIPNFEIKFAKTEISKYALENKIRLQLNEKMLLISQLELQIAFKIVLGSENDLADARYLYEMFKNNIDLKLFADHLFQLKIGRKAADFL